MWRSRYLYKRTKVQVFRVLVLPVLLCGCETWTLSSDLRRRLHSFSTVSHRRVLGYRWFDFVLLTGVPNEAHDLHCQTGRYILIQKLRDTERQLLANEKPLESLAKCGQYANDVQFILRRTGPSAGERPSSNSDSSGTSVGVPLPAKPAEAPKRKEPKKSMTFNLGSMGSVDFSTKKKIKPAEPNGGEKNVSTVNGHVSKEEIFKKVLVQQEQLQALEAQIKSLESEIYSWEHPTTPSLEDELLILQQTIRSNNAELEEEELWVNELQIEKEQERTMQWKLKDLHSTLDECTRKLGDFDTKSALLEQEIQQENADRTKKSKQTSRSQAQVEDSLVRIKAELENKNKQHSMLDNSLKDMKKAVMEVESVLQVLDHLPLIVLPDGTVESSRPAQRPRQHPLAVTADPNRAVENSISHEALRETEAPSSAREAATKLPGGGFGGFSAVLLYGNPQVELKSSRDDGDK
ncbi:RASF8 protein, partial [Polypterus senegalus]